MDHLHLTNSRLLSKFCEWISTADMRQWAGPVLELLLQHVAQVQLCGRLLELLDSREEWHAVKRTTRKHEATVSITCTGTPINPDPVPPAPPHSVAPDTAAPLQVTDTDPDGQIQTEVGQEPASARQTDQIPQPG